ncbi:hypothetical protein LL912_03610 [Niabella sp. CC-SYL272]|uniref:hypothetical protein n=1 Tax=Niabella agricola TaxID=2891571 RepID=UPI001F3D4CEE|nr:hypothetical protein [Niabella agricola]MCF3107857.1 hypothetical protein [Niabella agricola]
MKQLLITAAAVLLFFSCKKELAEEKEPAREQETAKEQGPVMQLVAEYKTVSYTRAYGMHPKGGSKETADKPFGTGYSLVQLFSKNAGGPVSDAFVVMINKDGELCGQDTVAVKSISPGIFELLENAIGSYPLKARTYIRISPIDDQPQTIGVGAQALMHYDGPGAGVTDWVYQDYQTVVRTK